MKRKLGWFGLGFAGAELVAANCRRWSVCPAAAFWYGWFFGTIQGTGTGQSQHWGHFAGWRGSSCFRWCGCSQSVRWQGRTAVRCTAVIETDAEASYSDSRLRGTLLLTEIDGNPPYPGTVCIVSGRSGQESVFPQPSPCANCRTTNTALSRNSKGCLSAGGVSGRLPCVGRQPWRAVRTVPAAWAVERHTAALAAEAAGRHGGRHAAGGQEPT